MKDKLNIIENNMSEEGDKILDICNKIIVFDNGKIVKESKYGEIFD